MAMVSFEVLSKAKVNLMLRVLGRREDGYHNLQTAFQLLEWGDQMKFTQLSAAGTNQICIRGFDHLRAEENLIYKAAKSLLPWAKTSSDWQIDVKKIIPQGSGLGGGSSNAAMTFKFLNKHWHCELSEIDLMTLAVKLGADIPIFIADHAAFATGTGNQFEKCTFNTPYILLVFPPVSINTAELFNHPLLNRNQVVVNQQNRMNDGYWINDFFPLVLHEYPEIRSIYEATKDKVKLRLSGTGSTLFAVFDSLEDSLIANQLMSHYARCEVVKPFVVEF